MLVITHADGSRGDWVFPPFVCLSVFRTISQQEISELH